MTISQRSNTIVCYNFDEKSHKLKKTFVAFSLKEYTLGCF
jgi:hypothetical protein